MSGRARGANAARRPRRPAGRRRTDVGEGAASMRRPDTGTRQLAALGSARQGHQLAEVGGTLISKCFRAALLAVAATALVGGTAACSSGGDSGTTSTTTTPSTAAPATTSAAPAKPDFDAFSKCMTDNGMPAPQPGGPPPGAPRDQPAGPPPGGPGAQPPAPGVDQATWEKAFAACASLAPPPPR